MARLRKDVLKPATYSVPDATGKKRFSVSFGMDDITHLLTRYHDMKAAGLHVPVSWNHQNEAKPADEKSKAERLANRAKHVIGWDEDARLVGDTLEFDLDIPDEADAKQARTTRYVSPEMVTDWVDGSGRMWPGRSITHIAVTAMPVQADQQPMQQLSTIRLSLADISTEPIMTIDLKPTLAYLAKRKIKLPKTTKPTKLLTRLNTVRLGYEAGDEEDEEKAEKETEGGEGGGKAKMMEKVIEYLQGQGIHLPDDTDEANFIERLCVACHALENAKGGEDVAAPNPNDAGGAGAGGGTPQPADTGGVMMSLQRDVKKQTARADAAEAKLLKAEKAGLLARIDTLKVSKPIKDGLRAQLKTERLSLTESGDLAMSELVTTVKAYEKLDSDSINPVLLSLERGGTGKPQVVPNPDDAPTTPDQHVMDRLTGGRYKVPANGTAN